jgi:hypothetical protein
MSRVTMNQPVDFIKPMKYPFQSKTEAIGKPKHHHYPLAGFLIRNTHSA